MAIDRSHGVQGGRPGTVFTDDVVPSRVEIKPPEPALTAADLIERAAAMRDEIRAEAADNEARGGYSPERHRAFTEAGFYRMLQPRRYGGYEITLDDFLRVVIEVSRADPSTGWAMCLASAHVFQFAAFFGATAQDEMFPDDGHVVIPSRNIPRGTVTPTDGGWILDGTWDYASGCTYATHMMGVALDPDQQKQIFIIPAEQITRLDDWGGAQTLGLGGSGSNSVLIDKVRVPSHRLQPYVWKDYVIPPQGTPGYQIHGNPMYLARTLTLFWGELAAIMVGAARGMLDEYERLIRERPTSFPPPMPRIESLDYLRWFGEALALIDTAEFALLGAAGDYMDRCRRWGETGEDFAVIDDARLRDVVASAARVANQAITLMFDTGGSNATRTGSQLLRYYRDASMFRTHIAAQYDAVWLSTGRVWFGGELSH
jgi:3-hydroxy-9,10-secoandrosta-1,3,5(10)-triene-9,17-dione monooxygenase